MVVIKKNTQTNKKIKKSIINKVLKETYATCSFSTIPYFKHNTLSSAFCLKYYHSGNCIAMSMCAQQLLKKYDIYSFLIPASIPKKYQRQGYLDISHVALCIPEEKAYYIIDCAFYFLKPIYVKYSNISNKKKIQNKNIYSQNKKETIVYTGSVIDKDQILNDFQFIPKDTHVCNVYYENDPGDSWNYYIINVINPDDSIGRTFFNVRPDNFITITDELCNLILYVKQTEQFKNNIEIKYKEKKLFSGTLDTINNYLVNLINDKFKLFIPNGLLDALE